MYCVYWCSDGLKNRKGCEKGGSKLDGRRDQKWGEAWMVVGKKGGMGLGWSLLLKIIITYLSEGI
jgi:hypothetical protein